MKNNVEYGIEKIIEDMEFTVTLNQTIANLKHLKYLSVGINYETEISKALNTIENIKYQETTRLKERALDLVIGE